ncbi:N-formylglutamate amidohydrolase [Robiginitalea sp.]|jgi:hypothetical protein|uniref:N-formylglutamate amidohydrolase n=1 Tax=Robiginitalea sp. TaxID=1902411 RepID=UPI003C728716
MMRRLTPEEMIGLIQSETPFEAVASDYSFRVKVASYAPYICAAVHDGHQFRKSLWDICTHTDYERWYEEDPCTREMVASHPIVISGADSRFEYDLNRPPEDCIFEDAWGKPLWKSKLPQAERAISLAKHNAFYRVAHALNAQIESKYGAALVFDMHSYNWKRWDRVVPTWNLGTTNIDNSRFGFLAESWRSRLAQIQLPHGIPSTARINDVFFGKGYFLKSLTDTFENTLVLATEISKVYCDETSGIIFPEVVDSAARQLKELIPLQLTEFQESL